MDKIQLLTPEQVLAIQTFASSLFSKENITFALSIFGSLGTAFTMIHTFLTNRKRLQMKIIGHIFGDTKMLIVYAAFENKSRLPISITDISVKIGDIYFPCVQPPIVACEETERVNGMITSHRECTSLAIPINVASLNRTSGYICFEFPPNAFQPDATELIFSVVSNRGKVFEKTLSLGRQLD